jgi:cysteine desulfurase
VDPRVLAAMRPWWEENFANPGSVEHALGRAAEEAVEAARAQVADLIGADANEIILTSGATEANNLAIKGAARFAAAQGTDRRRVVDAWHRAQMRPRKRARPRRRGLRAGAAAGRARRPARPRRARGRAGGGADAARLRHGGEQRDRRDPGPARHRRDGEGGRRTVPHGCGAGRRARAPRRRGDGRGPALPLGHKVYGPKGVGALYVRRRPRVRLAPLFSGGGQERGLRSGTLPAPLLVGFGEACRVAAIEGLLDAGRIAGQRDRFMAALSAEVPGLVVHGSRERRVTGNLSIAFPGGVTAQAVMERAPGLCLSTGSACSSAEVEPSHVLRALGLPEARARATLRIGIGRFTSPAEVDLAAAALGAAWRGAVAERESARVHPAGAAGVGPDMPKMTFIERDGTGREVDAPLGLSVLEIAHKHGVDIEGACEGSLACSTCHVIVDGAGTASWRRRRRTRRTCSTSPSTCRRPRASAARSS